MALDDAQEAALRTELATAQTELTSTREALTKSNREGGQHRGQAERATRRADEAEAAVETKAGEHKQELATLRAELTGRAEAAETSAAERRASADQRVIGAELRAAAVLAGMKKPDYVKMLDTSSVKLDDDGKVVIPDTLFEDAKKSDPSLFGSLAPHTSNPQPPPKSGPVGVKKAADMTDAERADGASKLGITALR